MLYSDFKCKMVINLRNCKQLGRVSDLEFDEEDFRLLQMSGRLLHSLPRYQADWPGHHFSGYLRVLRLLCLTDVRK